MKLQKIQSLVATFGILFCGLPQGWAQSDAFRIDTASAASSFSTFGAPQNMGSLINAAEMDQLPVQSSNGLSLYFSSNRPGGQGAQDIWVSQRATISSAWGAPQNLGATLNTASNDTISSLSPDGREMFMQSNRAGGAGGSDIYVSTRTDTNNDLGWTAPVNAGAALNTASNDYMGNYFVDPATGVGTLFFNSDRAGGLGGNDIYQSTRNADGTFNPPTIISILNSTGTEERTSISRDGLEFYFSSNRLVPTTNQAIFVSTRPSTAAAWSPPVYVAGLSTTGSNAQPVLANDGTILYFVSNRTGGFGLGDIYSATRVSVNRASTADFDGDGRTDISVFRPNTGTWYVIRSGDNTLSARTFGIASDKIVPGDYDGDGRTDMAVFRAVEGKWYVSPSSNESSFSVTNWGVSTDVPVPGDYDGDGRTDIAVYRGGTWYIVQSSDGHYRIRDWGIAGDVPIVAVGSQ